MISPCSPNSSAFRKGFRSPLFHLHVPVEDSGVTMRCADCTLAPRWALRNKSLPLPLMNFLSGAEQFACFLARLLTWKAVALLRNGHSLPPLRPAGVHGGWGLGWPHDRRPREALLESKLRLWGPLGTLSWGAPSVTAANASPPLLRHRMACGSFALSSSCSKESASTAMPSHSQSQLMACAL